MGCPPHMYILNICLNIHLAKEGHGSEPNDNGAEKPTLSLVRETAKCVNTGRLEKWEERCIPLQYPDGVYRNSTLVTDFKGKNKIEIKRMA